MSARNGHARRHGKTARPRVDTSGAVTRTRSNSTVYPPGYGDDNLLNGVFDGYSYGGSTISQPWELGMNSAASFLSLNRILLSYAYITHGIIQTMIDQPVEDAFRGGLEFK